MSHHRPLLSPTPFDVPVDTHSTDNSQPRRRYCAMVGVKNMVSSSGWAIRKRARGGWPGSRWAAAAAEEEEEEEAVRRLLRDAAGAMSVLTPCGRLLCGCGCLPGCEGIGGHTRGVWWTGVSQVESSSGHACSVRLVQNGPARRLQPPYKTPQTQQNTTTQAPHQCSLIGWCHLLDCAFLWYPCLCTSF